MGSRNSILGGLLAIGAIFIAPYAVGFLFGDAIMAAAALGSTGLLVANSVVAMGIMALGSKLLGLDSGSVSSSIASSPILANESGGSAGLPIVYGRRLIGARRIYMNVTDDNKKLHMVMALAEGEIGRIRKVYLNDTLVIDTTISGATKSGSVTNGEIISGTDNVIVSEKHRNNIRFEYRLGSESQPAFSYLTGKASEWASTAQCKGIALAYFEFNFNRDVYTGVPTITVEIDGKKIKKVENLTSTYSIAYRSNTADQIQYTDSSNDSYGASPPDVLYDYLTNDLYGKAISPGSIDIQSFIDAKNYCAKTKTATFSGSSKTFTQYFINGHIEIDDTLYNNVKRILGCFQGYLIFSNGKYSLKINRERLGSELTASNLFLFDESNIIGKYDLQLGDKQTRFNRIKTSFWDRDNKYATNMMYYENADYVTRDNDLVLERDIELPMVTDARNAYYIGALILNQSRYQMSINFTAVYTAFECEVGDIVRITHPNLGFTEKLFRIMSMGMNLDGTIQITALEFGDEVYTITELPEILLPGSVTLPDHTTVTPPTGLTASTEVLTQGDGTKIVNITTSWTASTDGFIDHYEVRLTGDSTAYYTTRATSLVMGPLANGTYNIGVTAVNIYGARSVEIT
jgi:hypothetical protein